jgi:hypothetical protein
LAAPLRHGRLRRPQAVRHGCVGGVGTRQLDACANATARFTRGRFVNRTSAARSSSVSTTSARGRPIFGMPLLDHKSEISPNDFVSRGLTVSWPFKP